jgi:threonine synthase
MHYVSTRGDAPAVGFLDAVLAGLAPDGGLYVPAEWPSDLDNDEFRRMAALQGFPYAASHVIAAFAGEDLGSAEIGNLVGEAFLGVPQANRSTPLFDNPSIAPLRQYAPGDWLLELFHGPSLAFKDIAMQFIGPLFELALTRRERRLTVVCATSGDTGGAAVEALKNRSRIDLFVLLPKGRVSDVQRRFMTASGADNVFAIEIADDFDACQSIVKQLFADRAFAERASLSGVNSINWARIVAQSVYFHASANALASAGAAHFSIPTGNFGDAFSAYVAKRMGAPIGAILIATNANDIIARALDTGRYERAALSHATLSPAMDIQVASNFERLVFELTDRDARATRTLYQSFAQSGGFDLPKAALSRARAHFAAASVSDEETHDEIGDAWRDGMLVCPHTAVALAAAAKVDLPFEGPLITLATAHPAKFPHTVETATGVRPALPARCADLFERPERFDELPPDAEAVKQFLRERSRAWT